MSQPGRPQLPLIHCYALFLRPQVFVVLRTCGNGAFLTTGIIWYKVRLALELAFRPSSTGQVRRRRVGEYSTGSAQVRH